MDEARLRRLSRAWRAGVPTDEIAERFGLKSGRTAAALVLYYRRRRPELFPVRPASKLDASARRRGLILPSGRKAPPYSRMPKGS